MHRGLHDTSQKDKIIKKKMCYIYVSLFIQLILVKISYFLLHMTIIIHKNNKKITENVR